VNTNLRSSETLNDDLGVLVDNAVPANERQNNTQGRKPKHEKKKNAHQGFSALILYNRLPL
jgi:hypothetical protein